MLQQGPGKVSENKTHNSREMVILPAPMEKLDKAEEISRRVFMSWSCFNHLGNWSSHLRDLLAETYTLPDCRKGQNGYIPWLFFLWDCFNYGLNIGSPLYSTRKTVI